MPLRPLPPAPPQAYHPATYRARVGAYSGFFDEVRWGYYKGWLHGQVRRALTRKRWFQIEVQLAHSSLLVRVDDDGLVGTARLLRFDHDAKKVSAMTIDAAPLRTLVVGPHAGRGADTFVRAGDCALLLRRGRDGDAWHLSVRWDLADLDLLLHAAGASSVVTVGEGLPPYAHRPGLVQRACGLAVTGRARFRGLPIPASQARASLTYGNIFLPPTASGRSLVVHGPDGAVVLSDGDLLGATAEAALLVGGDAYPLPVATRDPSGRWSDPTGAVDLRFEPVAAHESTVERRFGQVQHTRGWVAGRVRGVVPSPTGPLTVDAWGIEERASLRG